MRSLTLLHRSKRQKCKRAKIPLAEQVIPASGLVTIRGSDDFYVKAAGEQLVFFIRGDRGSITAVLADRNVEIASMGSAKQRRAALEKREGERSEKFQAFATRRSGGRK